MVFVWYSRKRLGAGFFCNESKILAAPLSQPAFGSFLMVAGFIGLSTSVCAFRGTT